MPVRPARLAALAAALTLALTTLPATAAPGKPAPEGPAATPDLPADLVPALAPGNDAFAAAEDLGGPPASASGSTAGATTEPGEPLPCQMGASVWFALTPASAGVVAVDSIGSAFDTVLAVYRGTSLADLEMLACNDDSGGLQSSVGFSADGTTTYYVQLGGYAGETGSFTLSAGTSSGIAGTVLGEEGPLETACIDVYDAAGSWVTYATTSAPSGAYVVTGLEPGEYLLELWDCGYPMRYLGEWYDDAPDIDSATPVPVLEGQVTGGIDAILSLGGIITGTVDGAAAQLWNACVDAFSPEGAYLAGTISSPDGTYALEGLPIGDVRLRFQDCYPGEHGYEWWEEAGDRLSATPIVLEAGETVSGVDVTLPPAARIEGTITSAATGEELRACATAYDAIGDFAATFYPTFGPPGQYSIGRLRHGTHTVRFDDCYEGAYAFEWYEDAALRADATPVVTTEGGAATGIDAALEEAGAIRGRVTDATGRRLRFVWVDVYDAAGEWVGFDYTGPQGRYRVPGLREAGYRLRFDGMYDYGLDAEYYDDRASLAEADAVGVLAGALTDDVDAVLHGPMILALEDGEGTSVEEAGAGDRIGVALGQPPVADVTVTLDPGTQLELSQTELTFTAGDWNVPQEVFVTAVDDELVEGDHYAVIAMRASTADAALDGVASYLWVHVADDDLVPAETALEWVGQTEAIRGSLATLATRLTNAETGDPVAYERVRFSLGAQTLTAWTDEEGVARTFRVISAPYGSYEIGVSYAGDEDRLAPSETTTPFEVTWEFELADELGSDSVLLLNTVIPGKEMRFATPAGASAIVSPSVTRQGLPTGGEVMRVSYQSSDLTVELEWQRGSGGAFAGTVVMAGEPYVIGGTA